MYIHYRENVRHLQASGFEVLANTTGWDMISKPLDGKNARISWTPK